MTHGPTDADHLFELAGAVCDETASQADRSELNSMMLAEPALRLRYLDYCQVHAALRLQLHAHRATQKVRQQIIDAETPTRTEPDVAGDAAPAPTAPASPIGLWHGVSGYYTSGWPVAYLIATVIFAVGLLVGAFVHVSQPEQHVASPNSAPTPNPQIPIPNPSSVVARVTGMVDCEWEEAGFRVRGLGAVNHKSEIINHNSLLHLGDRLALRSGLLEITYDTGAKVILQGPVTYEVESSAGGYLAVGKLTAKLEQKSEVRSQRSESSNQKSSIINHQSFSIRTPTALVTDLGTEFGVEVDESGTTGSHVFRGLIRVQAVGADGTAEGDGYLLRENESAEVESRGSRRAVAPIRAAESSRFVREIPKPRIKAIDLVDVVAGGDGFSGRRNAGIDPASGKTHDKLPEPPLSEHDYTVGDRRYHRVETLPFVDGVFIPDGSRGPMQVDSASHSFEWFPTTNQTVNYVWACGTVHADGRFAGIRTVLNGIDYAPPGHGLLFLPSNQGITFNLDAIRHANPGHKLVRFRATAGNAEPASARGESVYADLWVLVDGQSRFRRRQISAYSNDFSIVVPITENDHFLTLASTDGGNGIEWDWIVFGDPTLELASARPIADSTPGRKEMH